MIEQSHEGPGTAGAFVLLDPACPHTPPEFVATCERRAVRTGRVVVGVRPVTDTVKVLRDGYTGETLDRDGLVMLCSPLVVPAAVAAAVDELRPGDDGDITPLVVRLAQQHDVEQVLAPPLGRRVRDADDRALLGLLAQALG